MKKKKKKKSKKSEGFLCGVVWYVESKIQDPLKENNQD